MNFAPPPCKPSNEPYTVPLPVYTLCGVEALLGEPLRHHGAGQRIGHPCPHLLALAQRASPYLTVITGFSNSKENMPNCLTRTRNSYPFLHTFQEDFSRQFEIRFKRL